MKNPYDILGVPVNASPEQIDAAYREQMRISANDSRRIDELNQAYDAIILNSGSQGNYTSAGSYAYYSGADYSDVRSKINLNRLEDAQVILDGIPEGSRDAQWYYLKGTIQHKRGWLEEAAKNFRIACNMDPSNETFRAAYNNVSNAQNGGYRTERRSSRSSGCSACDICEGLICADCCCECLGGDLISCC